MFHHDPTNDHPTPRPRRPATRYAGPPRYGYPKQQPSRMEQLEAEVAYQLELTEWLEARMDVLERCHACSTGEHEVVS